MELSENITRKMKGSVIWRICIKYLTCAIFFSVGKLGKNVATNGNKLDFQLNMANIFLFVSLKKHNYFWLHFKDTCWEKILLSPAVFLCRKSFLSQLYGNGIL